MTLVLALLLRTLSQFMLHALRAIALLAATMQTAWLYMVTLRAALLVWLDRIFGVCAGTFRLQVRFCRLMKNFITDFCISSLWRAEQQDGVRL